MLALKNYFNNHDLMPRKRFLIYVNLLVDSIGWSLIIPTLPYIHASFGMSNLHIGFISSFLAVMIFAFGMLQGRASDYFGRIRMLQLSALSQLVGHFIVVYAISSKSIILFIFARCLPAVFKCGMVVSQALLYDISNESDVSRNIASLMAYSNISFIVGPIIGGEAYSYDPLLPFYLGMVISVFNLLLLLYLDRLLETNSLTRKMSVETGLTRTRSRSTSQSIVSPRLPVVKSNTHGTTLRHRQHHSSQALKEKKLFTFESNQQSVHVSTSHSHPVSPRHNDNKYNRIDDNVHKTYIILLHYLHIRFAFQLNNSLLEALFAQHVKTTLQLSGSSIGRIMAASSLISALTNGVLLKRLLLWSRYPERFLWLLIIGMTLGLYGWILSDTLWKVALSIAVTAMCSNLFLNIMQSIIAQSQKQFEFQSKHQHDSVHSIPSAGSPRSRGNSFVLASLTSRGGGVGTVVSEPIIKSSFPESHSAIKLSNIQHQPLEAQHSSLDNDVTSTETTDADVSQDIDYFSDDDVGGGDVVEIETEGEGNLNALDMVRLRCLSSDSSDFSHSYVDIYALNRDVYGEILSPCVEGDENAESSSTDSLVENLNDTIDLCEHDHDQNQQSRHQCELLSSIQNVTVTKEANSHDSKVGNMTSSESSHLIDGNKTVSTGVHDRSITLSSTSTSTVKQATSIGVVFGLSSTTDRAARILSPVLGGLFIQYYGNMGLIYLTSIAATYCMILVLFCLPRRHFENNLKKK